MRDREGVRSESVGHTADIQLIRILIKVSFRTLRDNAIADFVNSDSHSDMICLNWTMLFS